MANPLQLQLQSHLSLQCLQVLRYLKHIVTCVIFLFWQSKLVAQSVTIQTNESHSECELGIALPALLTRGQNVIFRRPHLLKHISEYASHNSPLKEYYTLHDSFLKEQDATALLIADYLSVRERLVFLQTHK